MRAESLRLHNVRNHADTFIEIAPKINVLAGQNGAGKTSILEALSLATITKSFTTHSDGLLIRQSGKVLDVDARFKSDLGVGHNVTVQIDSGPPMKKIIHANSERIRISSDLVGRAPVVVLSPDEKIITGGGPTERRRFLNMVLSQASRAYLEDEIEYRRALKQRNAILAEARQQRRSLSHLQPLLVPWTILVMKHGTRIMLRRAKFVEEFHPQLIKAYAMLSLSKEEPSLRYLPMGLEYFDGDFESMLQEESSRCETEEIRRGTTLFGPHRDELLLFVNPGQEARLYASQGQHKTMLVAMKLAEFEYLREASGEMPMLLLDDVFSELDDDRARQLLSIASTRDFGQTFISSTERSRFETAITFGESDHRIFDLENGFVK